MIRFDHAFGLPFPNDRRSPMSPGVDGIFGGVRIVVSPDRPGYKLPEDLLLPPAFRAQFNAWAADFFDRVQLLPDGEVIFDEERGVAHMNPRTLELIRSACEKDRRKAR